MNAMNWTKENVSSDAKFIVRSNTHLQEWLPHLTQRTVLNMPYGLEWEPREWESIIRFGELLDRCSDLDCISRSVEQKIGYENVYLFIEKKRSRGILSTSNGNRSEFDLLWENDEVAIGYLSSR